MKKIFVFLLTLSLLVLPFFSSCGEDGVKTPDLPKDNALVDTVDKILYLIFEIDGNEKARIPILSNEPYEDLEPYFPTIPDEYGDDAYWDTTPIHTVGTNIKDIIFTKDIVIKLVYGDAVTTEAITETTVE